MFLEDLEDLANVLGVFFVILAVNQDVINVNDYTNVEEGSEDILNESLECGWGIGESKGHDLILIMAILGMESCLLNVILVDPDLVVSLLKINLGEY